MNKFIFILFIPLFLFSQVIDETFSNFIPDSTDASLKGLYILEPTSYTVTNDLGTSGNDLTAVGSVGDSTEAENIIISGGSSVFFDHSDDEYSNNSADFNPTAANFSFFVVARRDTLRNRYAGWISKRAGYGTAQSGWLIMNSHATGSEIRLELSDGAAEYNVYSNDLNNINYHVIVCRIDQASGANTQIWVDGANFSRTRIGDITTLGNITSTTDFKVGKGQALFGGYISLAGYYAGYFTDQQMKQIGYLATGWYSKSGGVTRDSWGWHQGIVNDTVYVPIPDTVQTSGFTWQLQFDAWSSSGTPTLNYFTSTLGGIQTVTTDSTQYTIMFGSGNFLADSLYFHTTSTVYIDNIVLSEIKESTTKGYNKFKGYGGY